MKNFYKNMSIGVLIISLIVGIFRIQASAHALWLNIRHYNLKVDVSEPAYMTLGYGHHFAGPGGEFMPKKYLDKLYIIDPKGKKLKVEPKNEVEYESERPLSKSGTYLFVATKKGGFSTKTTEGYKRGLSKKGLKNVIKCTYSAKFAKAIVNVGEAKGKVFSRTLGHKLEIIPLKDPAKLREGDYMPVKILFNGKPLPSTFVFATYAGFSTDKNAFAYANKTNKKGIANIRIIKSSIWLVILKHKVPYHDQKVCDQMSFYSTLTFEVR